MVKCGESQGRQGIFMCLAALLCQQFFPTCKWRCEDTDTLIRGSFALTKPCWLYSVFKCQNHNSWSAFANTNASPVNMALCRNVCIRSYFSRFFWRTRSLSRLNLSTCLPFVFVHRLVSVDHFLLHNIIHAKRWLKITWYLGAVLIPKHIYSTTSVVQEFFTEGKGESEHRIQLNKTTDNWPGICNFIVDLNLWLAYFKICLKILSRWAWLHCNASTGMKNTLICMWYYRSRLKCKAGLLHTFLSFLLRPASLGVRSLLWIEVVLPSTSLLLNTPPWRRIWFAPPFIWKI